MSACDRKRTAELRAYFKAHPHQSDTIDGIFSWWWELERFRESRQLIERSLEELIGEGVVVKRLVGNEYLYSLNREKCSIEGDLSDDDADRELGGTFGKH